MLVCWKESTSKLRTSVSNESFWLSMFTHKMLKNNVRSFFCIHICSCGNKADKLVGRSTITAMQSYQRGVTGRPVMKSMVTCCHGYAGIGKDCN